MKYLQRSFTVAPGNEKAYRDNYDRIFGKKSEPKKARIRVRKQLQPKKAGG